MGTAKGVFALVLLCCAASSVLPATCNFNTGLTINTADISNLADAVGINNISPPLESPLGFSPVSVHSVGLGNALFCIRNGFLFESTHITLSDIQFAANDIVSQCCGGPVCQGGRFTITGDTGLKVELHVQPVAETCEV